MYIYLISTLLAIIVLSLGEKLTNQTKEAYIKAGHDWSKVILYSNIAAVVSGLMSVALVIYTDMPKNLNPQFIPFATAITAYITTQSVMTDFKVLLINRVILRTAYISLFILALYNVTTNDLFRANLSALVLFTIILIVMFFFVPIGSSDIRAIAVGLPFVTSLGGSLGIILLMISLFGVSIFMAIKREKEVNKQIKIKRLEEKDKIEKYGIKIYDKATKKSLRKKLNKSKEHATPVGPFMIMPFMIYLMIYPIII